MSNRNEHLITLLRDAIADLEQSKTVVTHAKVTTNPIVRAEKLRDVIARHQATLLSLWKAQIEYNGGIPVTVGVGQGNQNPTLNLYVDIYESPSEYFNLGTGTRLFQGNGTGYVGSSSILDLVITGRYRVRDSSSSDHYWYRAQYTVNGNSQVGWISDNNRVWQGDVLVDAGIHWISENKPNVTDAYVAQLPEQDRDGTIVTAILYSGTTPYLSYAPLAGNIRIAPLQNGAILRVREYAHDSVNLGGNVTYLGVRIHYETPSYYFVGGWVESNDSGLDAETVQVALSRPTITNRTADFAGRFDSAVQSGNIPTWQMPPRFTFYPLSVAQTCDPSLPPNNHNIDGLGIPDDRPDLYGTPPYHPGTDFYAPINSRVYSIAPKGLVVGIGVGNPDGLILGVDSAWYWGSAILDDQRGYSVIVRYGHLYVLYGHLHSIEDTIFVGAPLNAGDPIGRIGTFNSPHVHIEVRNFDSPIQLTWLQPQPMRGYGFLTYAVTTALQRARHHYDLAQFFSSEDLLAWKNDTDTHEEQTPDNTDVVTGFTTIISDNTPIKLGNLIDQPRYFQVKMDLQTIYDPILAAAVRGLVQGTSVQSQLIAPSAVPVFP